MGNTQVKKLQVVIHCLPREIDQLERICNSLRENYYMVKDKIDVILDVTLNLNTQFTNWEQSKLPKEFFVEKFNNINKFNDWSHNLFEIDENNKCLGINDKRRNSINDNTQADYLMYLDLDVFFPFVSFVPLVQLLDDIENEYSIITMETVKLWDSSWEGLVNKRFKTHDNEFFKTVEPFQVNKLAFDSLVEGSLDFRVNTPIKFGGGWFNIFSKNLLKFINIPTSLGPYGLDDTFVMFASNLMAEKQYDIKQYILEGLVCIENNKYTLYDYNPYENFIDDLSFKNRGREFKQEYRENSQTNFNKELNKFANKI
jgi:hypothetical protein